VVDERLSQILTAWTVLYEAKGGPTANVTEAQRQTIQRYGPAIYRYLVAATKNPDAADDLFQEFALRFIRGDLARAEPGRGRFRDYLKTTLYHLIVDYQKRRRRDGPTGGVALAEPAAADAAVVPADDQEFLTFWRNELLNRVWAGLAEWERRTGQPLHRVLQMRTADPQLRSAEMAVKLSAVLGTPISADVVRKRLSQARDKFTDFLVAEVASSLTEPTRELVEEELLELGYLDYCKAAVIRRFEALI
jgi:RNA polymerase sigma-70 factor (ECF subfamily)